VELELLPMNRRRSRTILPLATAEFAATLPHHHWRAHLPAFLREMTVFPCRFEQGHNVLVVADPADAASVRAVELSRWIGSPRGCII
jgi:hypothetical protein